MASDFSYRDYVTDADFADGYGAYQKRYAETVRESDRVLIHKVRKLAGMLNRSDSALDVLDIGCSTGNLLLHLKRMVSRVTLTGGDLMSAVIAECRKDNALEGINFELMDMLALDRPQSFDVVIANAVLYMFDDQQFEAAIASSLATLRPGGHLLVFDFFHPFQQHLSISERSRSHPDGLMLYFRPMDVVRDILESNGAVDVQFEPFKIPIDLDKGTTYGSNEDGFEDLNSYTISTEDEGRLIFRGALYTPWCHLSARKSVS